MGASGGWAPAARGKVVWRGGRHRAPHTFQSASREAVGEAAGAGDVWGLEVGGLGVCLLRVGGSVVLWQEADATLLGRLLREGEQGILLVHDGAGDC